MTDLSVNIAGVTLKNPVIASSGTFGFGREYGEFFSLDEVGAVCVKGLTLKKRSGNPPPRIAETPMGILNSVGLQNPGVEAFVEKELPCLKQYDTKIIANISGNTEGEYCEMAQILSDSDTDLIEMNISCPNVKEGGISFGVNPDTVFDIVNRVKRVCQKPLIVKLSPNVSDIAAIAVAAEGAGADAISLINTLLAMKIDIRTRRPVLYNNTGGLSGPAIRPVAVRMVWQAAAAVKIPVIGMGGITCGEDAIEFILAGACAVGVGTATFSDPFCIIKVKNGIKDYLISNRCDKIEDIRGKLILNT